MDARGVELIEPNNVVPIDVPEAVGPHGPLLDALAAVSGAIVDQSPIGQILQLLTERALLILGAEVTAVSLVSRDRRTRTYVAAAGKHAPALSGHRVPTHHGLCGRVLLTGQPVIATSADVSAVEGDLVDHVFQARNVVAAPIRWRGKVSGVVAAYDKLGAAAFSASDLQTVAILANCVSAAMENARLHEADDQSRRELESVYRLSLIAGDAFDVEQSLRTILQVAQAALEFDAAAFLVYENSRLTSVVSPGDAPGQLIGEVIAPLSWSVADHAVATNQTLIIEDTRRDPRCRSIPAMRGSHSVLAAPLRISARTVGILLLVRGRSHGFPRKKVRIAEIVARYAAHVIDTARLLSESSRAITALEVDRKKTDFVARASHEVRTPIACIKSAVETLLREDITVEQAERREFLETISAMADRLTNLAEELLDLSKLQAGHGKSKSSPLPVRHQIEQAVRRLQVQGCRHALVIDVSPRMPPVWGDSDRLAAVLDNLLSNAVKYSPAGSTITIGGRLGNGTGRGNIRQESTLPTTNPHDRPTGFLEISVSDTGIGIPDAALGRLFEPFFQIENAHGNRRAGVGLGLYICKGYVEAMGGQIWARSQLGCGSTFTFSLPIAGTAASRVASPLRKL